MNERQVFGISDETQQQLALREQISDHLDRACADFVRTMAIYMRALGMTEVTVKSGDKDGPVGSVTLRVRAKKQ